MKTVDLNLEVSREIDARRRALAEAVTARQYELRPGLAERYGERGRAHCLQDAEYHLSYLADAIATSSPALFFDYVGWAKVMLAARGVPENDLATNLETVCETLRRELPGDLGAIACEYVEAGLRNLRDQPSTLEELFRSDDPLYGLARSYLDALLRGERHVASDLVLKAVEAGVPVCDLYLHVFQRSQHEVGRLWQTNRLSVAQEHYCTAATQLIMSQLYPYVFADSRKGRSMVATCIGGDLHEIGVRMVSDFFQMEGWDTFYLGANVPAPSLLKTLAERRADVLAVSATLTSHVRTVAGLIAAVRSQMGGRIKVLVGGYPFNVDPDLWRRVGADGSARDAREAVTLAERLVGGPTASPVPAAQIASGSRTASSPRESDLYDDLSRLNNDLATAQRDLAKSNAELSRLNGQKNQFLGMAAHDLRNPLEVILTYSEFLLEEAAPSLTPEQVSFIETIRSSSDLMLRLVEDLLDLARIEAGKLELDLERVDLAALVEANVARNRVLAAKKQIAIRLHYQQGGPLEMRIDPVKIEQVLNNLIGNAVKFSPPGSAVDVHVTPGGERVTLAVEDRGPGIPAEERDKLFRPFARTQVRSTAGEKGAGLGLAIVKRIVEGHGGEIRVESRLEGGGSAFRVSLPRQGLEGRWPES